MEKCSLKSNLKEERDTYVSEHEGWKKRGKICKENLERHLKKGV